MQIQQNQLQPHQGSPLFYQGQGVPSQNEDINQDAFKSGTLIFKLDRLTNEVYWLNNIDSTTNAQTWVLFPMDNLWLISIMPLVPDYNLFYWYTSQSDPTTTEPIQSALLTWQYSWICWNTQSGTLFKLVSYNPDTNQQTWQQLF